MRKIRNASVRFFLALALAVGALGAFQLTATEAQAQSSYFTARGCVDCHSAPTVATCAGCHQHSGTLTATPNKASFAPGEAVTITLTASGARSGWIGVRLYNQSGVEIARSTGNQSGMGGSAVYPAVLSAPAPATAGNYTWRMAYFGNQNGTGSGDVHGEKSVNVAITVAAPADATAPVVGAFTLPATATSLTVPVSSLTATDNVAVTGYLINKIATAPAAGAAGWSATVPASVTAVAGSNTFYAWAKDAAGNVSASRSATVTVSTAPAELNLAVSTLADGSYTNNVTLNVSGTATDTAGIQSITVNGEAVAFNAAGYFSTAVTLVPGANTITVVAIDTAGTQQTNSRTITFDPSAPVLTVAAPADNSTTIQSFLTVTGAISETSTVSVNVNGGAQQPAAIIDNTYSATVYLAVGLNTINITATDLAGNIATAKRTVTLEAGDLSLAITRPSRDITTNKSKLELKGEVTDAVGRVSVRITMDGRTYSPKVEDDGDFEQKLYFSKAKLYVITITATDAAGNKNSVIRNVIYRPATRGDDDDDRRDRDDD